MEHNKYCNGKIYAIKSYQTDKIYIGSTYNTLCKRFNEHKSKKDIYGTTSKVILNYSDAYIELIENYSCKNRNELNKREGEIIKLNKDNCVNKVIPKRTNQEWYNDNKEKIIAKQQKRRNNIKQELIDDDKEFMKKAIAKNSL